MSPMRGESKNNHARRMAGELDKREINERWRRTHVANSIEVGPVCCCPFREWPHDISRLPEGELRRHNDSRHFYVDERGTHRYSQVRVWRFCGPDAASSPERALEPAPVPISREAA